MQFYSQHGQDRYLFKNYFAGMLGRTFVDIGAHDGRGYSNTLFLEEALGWSGLCIEPSPVQFKKLQTLRRCTCLQCAVSDFSGEGEFLEFSHLDMMSGLTHHYKPRHTELANDRNIESHKILVPVRRLDSILTEAGIKNVDYCSIDTEGAELSILHSYDPNEISIDILSIENVEGDPAIRTLMFDRGYHLEAVFYGFDELYVRRTLARRSNEIAFSKISIAIPWNSDLSGNGFLLEKALGPVATSINAQRFSIPVQIEILLAIPADVKTPLPPSDFDIKLIRFHDTGNDLTTDSLAACFNNAQGAIFAILDCRDLIHPDRLQVGLYSLENHDIVSTSGRVHGISSAIAVIDDTQLSGWMFHRHVWDRLKSHANLHPDNDSYGWIEQLRQMGFTRCHQVEAGCPIGEQEIRERRSGLFQQASKFSSGSIIARHTLDHPLLERFAMNSLESVPNPGQGQVW